MFKKLSQNKKAQQTAEYAILIALVVGAVIAMQTYAQRTIQARIRGASAYLAAGAGPGTNILGTDLQYEPYYRNESYEVTRNEDTVESQGMDAIGKTQDNMRTRGSGGRTTTGFSKTDNTNW